MLFFNSPLVGFIAFDPEREGAEVKAIKLVSGKPALAFYKLADRHPIVELMVHAAQHFPQGVIPFNVTTRQGKGYLRKLLAEYPGASVTRNNSVLSPSSTIQIPQLVGMERKLKGSLS